MDDKFQVNKWLDIADELFLIIIAKDRCRSDLMARVSDHVSNDKRHFQLKQKQKQKQNKRCFNMFSSSKLEEVVWTHQ